jgi:hypothetical protein
MKALHRPDLYCWSQFDISRNVDFNGFFWVHPEGNVMIDPMPLSEHDRAHIQSLGGVAYIIITNSDHIRSVEEICNWSGALLCAPVSEQEIFRASVPKLCEEAIWLGDGDEPIPGLQVIALHGSKTPGELALLIEKTTLICGDLIRAHKANALMTLPDAKLKDKDLVSKSVQRLANISTVEHVLVGDGWPLFRDGLKALKKLSL